MKLSKRIYLIALIALSSIGIAKAQTYKNVEITPRAVVGSSADQLALYTSQFLKSNTPSSNSVSNEVFIRQVGNNNQFTSEIRSARSNVIALQQGNNNEARLSLEGVIVEEFLLQRGNNNIFYDIGSELKLFHSGQVIQNGSNQRLLFLGNNSLSDRLKVNMRGNNQTVIVRNIKRQ
jgi:hypothetical protein